MSVCRSVGRSVSLSVGLSVCGSVGPLVCWSVGCPVDLSVDLVVSLSLCLCCVHCCLTAQFWVWPDTSFRREILLHDHGAPFYSAGGVLGRGCRNAHGGFSILNIIKRDFGFKFTVSVGFEYKFPYENEKRAHGDLFLIFSGD